MAPKRPPSPALIPNPFIKKQNLEWALETPQQAQNKSPQPSELEPLTPSRPPTAAVESGEAIVTDHLEHFTTHLSKHIQPPSSTPRLPVSSFASLYEANAGSSIGAHFVIHQHDHPVAGTHYDLRLQINESSSVSWAIMYGLPGDPNSVRLNRNATKTRIHCLWNHLIETASPSTGSLLIWDTGTYTVLPRQSKHAPAADPSSPPGSPLPSSPASPQALLHAAFQTRMIRIQLHGTRLPEPYVLNMRITKAEDASGRARSTRAPRRSRRAAQPQPETSEDEDRVDGEDDEDVAAPGVEVAGQQVSAMEREIRELEDEHVRETNAYPGAVNTIGSIHQRRWYISLDRRGSGFEEKKSRGKTRWNPVVPMSDDTHPTETGKEDDTKGTRLSFPFYVRGADHERSVVTGRVGEDVLRDEGVTDFARRKGWLPVLN